MKVYKFLSAYEDLFKMMESISVDVSDIKYLNVVRDYLRLTEEGHKKVYIVQLLSDDYEISVATVYRIISRLLSDVDFDKGEH